MAKDSASIIAAISPEKGLHPDFGAGTWDGHLIGIPYVVVDKGQPPVPFENTLWASEGDPGPYPIPADAPQEGGGDGHVIVVQRDPAAPNGLGKLYEIFEAQRDGSGWSGQGAVFDMQGGDHQRPDGWTSADAAGLPIFPGLVRYDEVEDAAANGGTLGHALRFTLSQAHTATSYIGAASHTADSIDGAAPFGTHLRLKADFPMPANASPEVEVIINTLKEYGMILADNGSDWFVSGAPSEKWDDDALRVLGQVHGADFEVVDVPKLPATTRPDSGTTQDASPDPATSTGSDPTASTGSDPATSAGSDPAVSTGSDPSASAGSDPVDSTGSVPTGSAGVDPTTTGSGSETGTDAGGESAGTPTGTGSPAAGRTVSGTWHADTLAGTDGNDRIAGYGGADDLSGAAGDDELVGGRGPDRLDGGPGNDLLKGGRGQDHLIGADGSDAFVFTGRPGHERPDVVEDFTPGLDHVVIGHADAAGIRALDSQDHLPEDAFHLGSSAASPTDRVLYDAPTGGLWYDADGTGPTAAVQLATLANKAALTADDIILV